MKGSQRKRKTFPSGSRLIDPQNLLSGVQHNEGAEMVRDRGWDVVGLQAPLQSTLHALCPHFR